MANLIDVFGQAFTAEKDKTPEVPDYESQLLDAIQNAGLIPPQTINFNGKPNRFVPHDDKKEPTGWYIAFHNPDSVPGACFGDWRSNFSQNWCADIGRPLTSEEDAQFRRDLERAKEENRKAIEKSQAVAATTVNQIWENAVREVNGHSYLKAKQITGAGLRQTHDGRLIVPLYNENFELTSLQYIDSNGRKQMHSGAKAGGSMFWVGKSAGNDPVYIAEGYATAATISQVTGCACYVGFSAHQLVNVTTIIKNKHPRGTQIVVVADNDESGVGEQSAKACKDKLGVKYVLPPRIDGESTDANDFWLAGGDLAGLLSGVTEKDWLVQADIFCQESIAINWIVENWVQRNALIMVHGPSGSGKSFVVLDWCLTVADGQSSWNGIETEPTNVVYLAGEGHNGMRQRVEAWRNERGGNGSLSLWFSRSGADLDKEEGLDKVIHHINELDKKPGLIVVDTLHRFLYGDENNAQDTRAMLKSCDILMEQYGCSVLLVHHTGVSSEAQHRARGSSAWKGALDIEISIQPGDEDSPGVIEQKKTKDSEPQNPLYFRLRRTEIPYRLDKHDRPITTAILDLVDAPAEPASDETVDKVTDASDLKIAWENAGKELDEQGRPVFSKQALRNRLEERGDLGEATIKNYLKPSYKNGILYRAMQNGTLDINELKNYVIVDENLANIWLGNDE